MSDATFTDPQIVGIPPKPERRRRWAALAKIVAALAPGSAVSFVPSRPVRPLTIRLALKRLGVCASVRAHGDRMLAWGVKPRVASAEGRSRLRANALLMCARKPADRQ